MGTTPANALPSFARQTGQPCGACHVDFPGLTPFGREFKLGGYTLGGGEFPTTPFEGNGGAEAKALGSYAKKIKSAGKDAAAGGSGTPDGGGGYHGWVPPVAVMGIADLVHVQNPQGAPGVAPGDNSPYGDNNNIKLNQASIFWGGAITDHVGAFVQYTYEPVVGAHDGTKYSGQDLHWDNVDFRAANTGKIGNWGVTYGLTSTNNPSMADPWNTTPAWGFPYTDGGDLAPGPSAATMIDGAWAQLVQGIGGYAWVNDFLYVQLSGFWSLSPDTVGFFGVDPLDAPGKLDGVSPYWRVAVQPHWGNNWWEFGTFGMAMNVHPYSGTQTSATEPYDTVSYTNKYTDIGFDSQYQYQGDNYWVTLRGTYIYEDQSYDAAYITDGNAANSSDTLNTLRLYGSYAYGNNNRVVFSGQYFDTWGSADTALYNGFGDSKPDSNGFTAEIAFIPYILGHNKVFPWANMRLGAQYTWYNKVDGTTTGASDYNTFNLYLWWAD